MSSSSSVPTALPSDMAPPHNNDNNDNIVDASNVNKAGTKKLERKVVVPSCPAAVSTAFVLLRGTVAAVLGVRWQDMQVSLLQGTYIKEQCLSGKFSIVLGKKFGDGQLPLPSSEEDDAATQAFGNDQLLQTIEDVCNGLIQENLPITMFAMTKQQIQEHFGKESATGILDGSHKKTADAATLTVAAVSGCFVAVPPSTVYSQTGNVLTRVRLQREGCNVTAGKKARKAEITLKFVCSTSIAEGESIPLESDDVPFLGVVQDLPPSLEQLEFDKLQVATVRCPEGQALHELRIHVAQSADAAADADGSAPLSNIADDSAAGAALAAADDEEMEVTAWEVKGKIDYNKLVDQFGSTLIDHAILDKLTALTVGQGRVPSLHRFLRRGMFFSHRDLYQLLTQVEAGTPMYLYTGRGPSSESMHLGHLVPFLFTQWLQQAFDVPLVIQMTDDEKFIFKGQYDDQIGDNLDYFARLTMENAKDIIACGFDYKKTFIFSDLEYAGVMYPNIVRIWKAVTTNTVNGIFGFDGSSNIGKIAFPAVQAAPSFASSFPKVLKADRTSDHLCLIPCAIDQDPYFRMTRDIAHKLVNKKHGLNGKPALIHSKFFPPLQGSTGKMSSSDQNSAIFLTDSADDIHRKIMQHAFSGGQDTKEKQQELGADLDVDVSYQWLRFFLEDDDELQRIGQEYSSGSGEYWSTGSVKRRLISILQDLVAQHQGRRAQITEDDVRQWMAERSIVG